MPKVDLRGRDLITTQDWCVEEIESALKLARELKVKYRRGSIAPLLRNKTFFMLFYAASTRTRAAFEAGMTYLGGHSQYIDVSTTRLGAGEAVKDVAKMYEKYGHGLGIRILDSAIDYVYGAGVSVVREYAKHSKIPVINMACCTYHPSGGLGESEGKEVRDNVGILEELQRAMQHPRRSFDYVSFRDGCGARSSAWF